VFYFLVQLSSELGCLGVGVGRQGICGMCLDRESCIQYDVGRSRMRKLSLAPGSALQADEILSIRYNY
jgi:hypothetical protein